MLKRPFLPFLFLLLLWPITAQAATNQPSALLVVSSHGRDNGALQPGFEMDELSQAWLILTANGYDVQIASPEGGKAIGDKFNADKPYNKSFLADPKAVARLDQTLRLTPSMGNTHDIVMVIGGKGAMFDLPISQTLQQILLEQHDRGAVVAAVCHGPAVFAYIARKDGSAFTKGLALTGFTNEEEQMFGKKWVKQFPFLIETRFAEQGARFGEAPFMLPNVAVDGRVVTGQNPYSVAAATEAAIKASGRTPKPRTQWSDEKAAYLLSLAANGERKPLVQAIARERATIDIPLIAIWSYYHAKQQPGDAAVLTQSIETIRLARPHMNDANLDGALAELEKARAALCPGGVCPAAGSSQ